jgi:salicylate hydroxylase
VTPATLIAGGGIGGLAAGLALAREGCSVRLFEQAQQWSEAGAGIQLGPNATRVLHGWGLQAQLAAVAARPRRLRVLGADNGGELAALELGDTMQARYGAPYLTVHRADLHDLLLQAAAQAGCKLAAGQRVEAIDPQEELLVAADGVWSGLRDQALHDGPARATGHVAYRTLIPQGSLRTASDEVRVWLGPRSHAVAYPVRRGEFLNLVVLVEGGPGMKQRGWEREAAAPVLAGACDALQELLRAAPQWGLWSLHDRPPLAGPHEMAQGHVALLGDAAHPMLPYLAQGAAMALEDARELALCVAAASDVTAALERYAANRWQRCARVQRRAARNAVIFHATGPLRWGRDAALRLAGARLLDLPWLFGG